MTTGDLMGEIAAMIWGDQWQPRLAEALRCRRDTVAQWRRGRSDVPHYVFEALRQEAERQQSACVSAELRARTVIAEWDKPA